MRTSLEVLVTQAVGRTTNLGTIHTLLPRGTHIDVHILSVVAKHALPTHIQVVRICVVAGVALGGIETEGALCIRAVYLST